jgi:hypothetical protein
MAHIDGCGCSDCRERARAKQAQARYRQRVQLGLVKPRQRQPVPKSSGRKTAAALAKVFTTPQLPGARCVGRWEMFDPDGDDDQHQQAMALCRNCPALTRCSDWLESLQPQQRPHGVIAGRLITEESR